MKTINLFASVALALILSLTGCKPSASITALAAENKPLAPEFSPKSGIYLPDKTRESLGLKLVEVAEQKIVGTIPISLRVYRTNSNSILTSTTIAPEQALLFPVGETIHANLRDNKTAPGKVQRVSAELQHVTGSMELLVAFDLSPEGIAIGDFIEATTKRDSGKNVVTIPRRALLESSEGQFAYTVNGDRFVRTAVKTGASNDEFIEITDGLYTGDQVVEQPVLSLWLTELASVKGGQACCLTPPKGK